MADRTRWGTRWLIAAGTAALVLAAGRLPAASQRLTVPPIDLAIYYELGEYAAVETALQQAANGNFDVLLAAFEQDAARWIDADGPEFASRRRLVMATVALEAAYAALDTQWSNSKLLLQWACKVLRSAPKQPAERDWHLAAIALFEGARDLDALGAHLGHVRERFPAEPRILLAEAFRRESDYLDDVTSLGQELGPGRRVRTYEAALATPGSAREAHLRAGFLFLQGRDFVEAIRHLHLVDPPDDPGQLYLARLFEGWALQRQERPEEAARAFRAALDAVPGAYTASLVLALQLYRAGGAADADALMDAVAQAEPPVIDPWRIYGYGDLRRWPLLIAQLRRDLQ